MEKVTITKVNYKDTDKEGNPLISKKSQKPYWKVGILTNEYGEKWINGFLPFCPDKWEGTTQEVEIFDDEKWGKQFKLPPKSFGGGMSETDRNSLALAVRQSSDAVTKVNVLRGELQALGVLPTVASGGETADFDPKEEVDPEIESLNQSAEAAMVKPF